MRPSGGGAGRLARNRAVSVDARTDRGAGTEKRPDRAAAGVADLDAERRHGPVGSRDPDEVALDHEFGGPAVVGGVAVRHHVPDLDPAHVHRQPDPREQGRGLRDGADDGRAGEADERQRREERQSERQGW